MVMPVHTNPMTAISFQATEADLVAAYRTQFLASVWTRRALRSHAIGATIFAALSVWLLGPDDVNVGMAVLIGVAYWFGLMSLLLGIIFLRLPRRVRRIFAQQKSLHGEMRVEWLETSISFQTAHGNSNFEWSDYVRLIEGRDTILLMQSDALFNFIPKSAITPDQAATIMASK
jgi:hypothetical protein